MLDVKFVVVVVVVFLICFFDVSFFFVCFLFVCMCFLKFYTRRCVCVCMWERERERERGTVLTLFSPCRDGGENKGNYIKILGEL